MLDITLILNTCYETTNSLRAVASYSHIVPVVLSIILGFMVLVKSKFNFFSKVFFAFIFSFSLWLIGDYIVWTSNNYALVYAIWSYLLYIEIIFYALGLYFAVVFVRKSDISTPWKILLFALTIPAFWLTVSGQSVAGFNQPVCEAYNNTFLDNYKLFYEGLILATILIYALNPIFNNFTKIRATLVVLGSMFLFLATFGVTEYLASVTGYYELNLYSLFLLPVFLVTIIYSVFELDIFNFKILGTHYLVVGFIILMGGQLFFITDTTNRLLTILAMIMAGGMSVILFRNLKKESDQRVQIAKLNIDLERLLKQRESLVHLVTHKVKGSFTRSKYIFASILDGTYGEVSPDVKKIAEQGLDSDKMGIETVDLVLNVANMQKGTVKYDLKPLNLKELVEKNISDKKSAIEARGLKIENNIKEGAYQINGDVFWLKEAIANLIENSVRYTPAGTITINLERKDKKIILSVKDTGIGLTDEDKKSLFTEGGRGKNSVKVNVDSTGYGLYSVKLIVDAHHGRVWAESEGAGKGSTFYMELAAA